MSWDLEHPDITAVNRTGYPRGHREEPIYCGECGKDITHERQFFDRHNEFMCMECLLYFHERDD